MTTSAGRWFDAMAGLLGLAVRQAQEAEAAIALERTASAWLEANVAPSFTMHGLDLRALALACLERADAGATGEAAALFHIGLADGLACAAIDAARTAGTRSVVLGGGCFCNRLLTSRLVAQLAAAGLEVQQPLGPGPGDAGLALGQAWIAAHLVAGNTFATHSIESFQTHDNRSVRAEPVEAQCGASTGSARTVVARYASFNKERLACA